MCPNWGSPRTAEQSILPRCSSILLLLSLHITTFITLPCLLDFQKPVPGNDYVAFSTDLREVCFSILHAFPLSLARSLSKSEPPRDGGVHAE